VGREVGANLRSAFRSVAEGSACGRELRSLFGSASRQMSLWSLDRNPKTAATGFEEAEVLPEQGRGVKPRWQVLSRSEQPGPNVEALVNVATQVACWRGPCRDMLRQAPSESLRGPSRPAGSLAVSLQNAPAGLLGILWGHWG
jgi:hypothetical protein